MTVSLHQVLKNILSMSQGSTLRHSLDHLLGKVCEACNDLFGFDLVWIGLVQEGTRAVIPIAASGQEEYLNEVLTLGSSLKGDCNSLIMALDTKQTVTVSHEKEFSVLGQLNDLPSKKSLVSSCSIPLLSNETALGVMSVYSKNKNAFTPNNILTLELLANLASMIIANARLIDEKTYLQAEQKTLLNAIDASIDGIAICTLEGSYTYMNQAHARTYGFDCPAELLGKSWKSLYAPTELAYFHKHIIPQLLESGHWRGEAVGKKKNGTPFHQELSLTLLKNQAGLASDILCNVRDITERKAMELELIETKEELESLVEQLKTLAVTDDLTSLYNTRKFYDDLKKEMKRSNRTGRIFSLLVIDVDNFKQYNDVHGHLGGDKVLKKIGRLLKNNLRHTDLAYRYGGDEFVVILPETDASQAKDVADKIRLIYQKFELYPTTLSIGIAEYNPEYDHEQIIKLADVAMYEAKKQGNRVCITNQLPVHLM